MRRHDEKLFEVRPSSVHGLGGFALRKIHEGTRIAEYVGERLTGAQVDARYPGGESASGHTFLYHVGGDTYVDASHHGNESRFINHSCDPNCESDVIDGHVYIVALRDIEPGEELTYDYSLEVEEELLATGADRYDCHCGAPDCRGTMLEDRSEATEEP